MCNVGECVCGVCVRVVVGACVCARACCVTPVPGRGRQGLSVSIPQAVVDGTKLSRTPPATPLARPTRLPALPLPVAPSGFELLREASRKSSGETCTGGVDAARGGHLRQSKTPRIVTDTRTHAQSEKRGARGVERGPEQAQSRARLAGERDVLHVLVSHGTEDKAKIFTSGADLCDWWRDFVPPETKILFDLSRAPILTSGMPQEPYICHKESYITPKRDPLMLLLRSGMPTKPHMKHKESI